MASGEFLEFDTATSTFRVGAIQARLLDLGDRISQFALTAQSRNADQGLAEDIASIGAAARAGAVGGVTVRAMTLRVTFVLRNQLRNILWECMSLGRYLAGIDPVLTQGDLVPLFPPPNVPSPENDRQMTDEEVDEVLKTGMVNGSE